MNGYVEAGYVVVLGTLGTYGVTLLARERAVRRRVGATSIAASAAAATDASTKTDASTETDASTKTRTLSRAGDPQAVDPGVVEETGPGAAP
jgi:hypothetical protein